MARSLRTTQQALDDIVDPARVRKRWNQQDDQWADAADVSVKTLQRFWRCEPIYRANFIAICQAIELEDWKAIADLTPSSVPSVSGPGVYGQATWVERLGVTASLLEVLQSSCRVVAIAGITGIGKTALAERLVAEVDDDKQWCRLNLDDGGLDAEFASSGAALLRSLGEEPTLEDQQDPANLRDHILKLLRTKPYRVQLESLEHLLQGNDQEGWSEFQDPLWLDLFQQILAGDPYPSQVLLTTQEIPDALDTVGDRYPQLWHCEVLQGLNETEQLALFRKIGLEDNSDHHLRRIGQLYEGHPLILRVIAEEIVKDCRGNVAGYWQQCKFADLEEQQPVSLSRPPLRRRVKQRVKQSLERLPEDAYQLLCRSAVYRRPVPEFFWLAMLPDCSEEQGEVAIGLLIDRGFAVEDWEEEWLGADGGLPLRQHNLIRSVAYELLQTDSSTWQMAEHNAAEQWLTVYKPKAEVKNLETVREYLEAFYHYCKVEDWDAASELFMKQLNPPSKSELYWLLYKWSYYQEQLKLCEQLSGHTDSKVEGVCHNGVGLVHVKLANYPQAIAAFQKSFTLAQGVEDRRGEGNALGNLGLTYSELGEYQRAINTLQQQLAIVQEIGDRSGEGNALGNLGNAYDRLGEYQRAIDFHQKHLAIKREIGDHFEEGMILGNLGISFKNVGKYQQAINCYQQCRDIAQEMSNRYGEGLALGNMGVAYYELGEYQRAINCYQKYLEIAKEIGDRRGEGIALGNRGEAQIKLGQYDEALENLKTSLIIFQEIQAPLFEAEVLKTMADLYHKIDRSEQAKECCETAFEIATELGIPLANECRELMKEIKEQ